MSAALSQAATAPRSGVGSCHDCEAARLERRALRETKVKKISSTAMSDLVWSCAKEEVGKTESCLMHKYVTSHIARRCVISHCMVLCALALHSAV